MAYGSEVRRRFASARHKHLDEAGGGRVATGVAEDRTLNVWVKFQMRVEDSVVVEIGYEVFGCPETIAAASSIAERLEGQSIATLPEIDVHALAAGLSIPVDKLGKLLRIEDAVLACLRQAGAGDEERKR